MPHFECGAFNHSATSPYRGRARARNLATKPWLRKCGAVAFARPPFTCQSGNFLRCNGNQRGRSNISAVVPDLPVRRIGGDMAAGGVFAIQIGSGASGHSKDLEPDFVSDSGNKASVSSLFTTYKGFLPRWVVGFRSDRLVDCLSVALDRHRMRYEHLRKRGVSIEMGGCVAI